MKTNSQWIKRLPDFRIGAVLLAGALATISAVGQTTLASFQFNEGTGRTTTSATNTLVGSLGIPVNAAEIPLSVTDTPSGATGDRAVQMPLNGYLVVDDSVNPILNLRSNAMTLEAWVKHDIGFPNQYEGIMAYGSSYKLGLDSGQIIFTLFGVVDIPSGFYLTGDSWHHVAVTYEPGVGVTFYMDGVPSTVAETRPMRAFQNNIFSIGAEGLGGSILATLDRVRVHTGLLTADQLDSVAATPKAPLANTLVAYSFNEAAMPYQNSAATPRPTIVGAEYINTTTAPVFSADSPTGGAGDFSMDFTSAGRRIIVPDPNTALRLDNGDFTIQAWLKFGAQPQSRSVLFFNSGPGCAVSFSVENRALFVTTLGILDQPSTATIPDDGGWHHVAVTHQSGVEYRFYVDGILGATVPYTGGVLIDVRTDTQFYMGCEPWGSLPYVGKMDRFSFSKGIVPVNQLDYRAIPGVDPGAPELTVKTVIEIAWPTVPAGYTLQTTTNIVDQTSWVNVTGAPYTTTGKYVYYAPITQPRSFYRLYKP